MACVSAVSYLMRYTAVHVVGPLPMLSTASAVPWVGPLVVVRWKISKAFMFVFRSYGKHFESDDLFEFAAAVVH